MNQTEIDRSAQGNGLFLFAIKGSDDRKASCWCINSIENGTTPNRLYRHEKNLNSYYAHYSV